MPRINDACGLITVIFREETMKRAIHMDGSEAGLFPVSLEVVRHKRGVELYVRVGSWGYRSVIPNYQMERVGDLLKATSKMDSNYIVSWRGSESHWNPTSTRIRISQINKDLVRCYLAICMGPIPLRGTIFKIEKNKLAALGAALERLAWDEI